MIGVIVGTLIGGAVPARADPAGPTDYETSIMEIDPPTPGIEAEMIGGDSFLLLDVDAPEVVQVVGYEGEPYLRFLPGGSVEQNEVSPTAYLNEDRYAAVEIPAEASAEADPIWRPVAEDGSYAWHDHRAHWMNDAPPPGRSPGDVILEGVVPLLVGDSEVDLTVRSVWQSAPSPLPVVAGFVSAILAVAWVLRRRKLQAAALACAAAAAVASGVGFVGYVSMPPEAAPSPLLWAAPATSLVLAALVLAGPRVGRGRSFLVRVSPSLVAAAAAIMAIWGFVRWDWLWRAILPTSGPFWLDRMATAAALAAGMGLVVAVGRERLAGEGPG